MPANKGDGLGLTAAAMASTAPPALPSSPHPSTPGGDEVATNPASGLADVREAKDAAQAAATELLTALSQHTHKASQARKQAFARSQADEGPKSARHKDSGVLTVEESVDAVQHALPDLFNLDCTSGFAVNLMRTHIHTYTHTHTHTHTHT